MAGRRQQRRPGDWDCPRCGELVFASKRECGRCTRQDRDWTCDRCGNLVFGRRSQCGKCFQHRSTTTGPTRVRPGDWWCESCAGLNFGTRTHCFKCGQARRPDPITVPDDEDTQCTICCDRGRETCLPCGHVIMCMVCTTSQRACPLCRVPYTDADVKKVYLS